LLVSEIFKSLFNIMGHYELLVEPIYISPKKPFST
jgi:hypothetical protein